MNIIFDVDGTLWDTTDVVATAWQRAMEDSGIKDRFPADYRITGDILKKEFGKPMDIIADDLFGELEANKKAELLEKCCIYEHEAVDSCTDDLTFEGVVEGIKELAKKHKLYIVSNCQSGYIELVIKKLGIEEYIIDFECFGNTNKYKAENILLLMERNGLADNTVYVGDTLGDFKACAEAKVDFIFAEYGFGDKKDILNFATEEGTSVYNIIGAFKNLMDL